MSGRLQVSDLSFDPNHKIKDDLVHKVALSTQPPTQCGARGTHNRTLRKRSQLAYNTVSYHAVLAVATMVGTEQPT